MTRYALNTDRGELIAVCDTGDGPVFHSIATSTTLTTTDLGLATELTALSAGLWRAYTHPASTAPSLAKNTEGWRRRQHRAAFTAVVPALTDPNLPHGGTLAHAYEPVAEAAHRIGRRLHTLADRTLTDAIAADVRTEIDAVERAELGDLTGRAAQATALSRPEASPIQVAAAHDALTKNPIAPDGLTHLDPTSAAVAAAHWLWTAVHLTAEATGHPADVVLARADDIETIPYPTPTVVFVTMDDGDNAATDVVSDLISDALDVADGITRYPDQIIDRLSDNPDDDIDTEHPTGLAELGADPEPPPHRLTPLDPKRPAQDLLGDLLEGIRGCQLLFLEEADGIALTATADDGPATGVYRTTAEAFTAQLTARAIAGRQRIGL
ncbi:hypothetical protein [Cryptosporangium sp. NPDC051539]|uniref:hypothetical protein n=1 Tax=Cryptosporangium sp. NPDC051539 TaxID=3363962 RepID=UPI0037AAA4B1